MGYTATELDRLIGEFADALRRRIRLDRILLFGSRARGEATEDSDIDLLVISPDFGRDVLADMVLLRECLPPHEVDIDTIARTPEQVAAAEPDSFLATVLEEGVVVYPARS
jgi:predicted nucleotidyltransferase